MSNHHAIITSTSDLFPLIQPQGIPPHSHPHRISEQFDLEIRPLKQLLEHSGVVNVGVTDDSLAELLPRDVLGDVGAHQDRAVDTQVPIVCTHADEGGAL